MNRVLVSITGLSLVLLMGACGAGSTNRSQSGSGGSAAGSGGTSGGSGGGPGSGGAPSGSGGRASGSGGAASGGITGSASGGTTGSASGGGTATGTGGGAGSGGTAGPGTGGAGTASGGAGGTNPGSGGATSTGGSGDAAWPKPAQPPADEDGSQLWLRYPKIALASKLAEYQAGITHVVTAGSSATLQLAQTELVKGLSGLLGQTIATADAPTGDGAVVLGTPDSSALVKGLALAELSSAGKEGYVIQAATVGGKQGIVIAANTDVGVLHGTFAFLRHLQCFRSLQGLAISAAPKVQRRLLNHWDNMDGTIERGYAGKSLWSWGSLPGTISQRYKDYARANASLGINGAVLNNVNSDAQILTSANLDKVAALATAFRPYGIAVYLSARFDAPMEIGSLKTADPMDSGVQKWWSDKVNEIYMKIPDFGGFLVKANAEGQPGPQDYNRTHADGAKLLGDPLAAHGGIVLWRAFVYNDTGDRIRQAYDEFHPLDGKFVANALVQVKNGPLDFQPREPFSALFGAMNSTPVALEVQITKEYLGEDTHLAYLGPLWEEVLKSDTYAKGQGSLVARVIDGSLQSYKVTAMSGVANIGSDTNWTGSHFNQANWYAFGRLAWDPDAKAQDLADEWIRQTFTNDPAVVAPVTTMMMGSRQNLVNYMTPLGLAHQMGTDHHYGPSPWVSNLSMADWNPAYYNKADATGIGFDRTAKGSNAVAQYFPTVGNTFASLATIPDDFLLFFQHVGWDDKLKSSGRSIWEELVYRYSAGVDAVQPMRDAWASVQGRIDTKRFNDVQGFLQTQHYEARWWRDACLQYFASVSKHSIPSGYAAPAHDLSWYMSEAGKCPADATKPRCPDVYTGSPSPAITK